MRLTRVMLKSQSKKKRTFVYSTHFGSRREIHRLDLHQGWKKGRFPRRRPPPHPAAGRGVFDFLLPVSLIRLCDDFPEMC